MGAPLPQLGYPREPEQQRLHRLGGLLARWHCWRKVYTPERGYARVVGPHHEPEDMLEHMLMVTIEDEVAALSLEDQRAVAQVAKAECLGVECEPTGSSQDPRAIAQLQARLIHLGVL